MNDISKRTHTVSTKQANVRLDRVVAEWLPELSRRELRELFEAGSVRSAGNVLAKGQPASAGQLIEITLEPPVAAEAAPRPIVIVQETADWVVVNKPAGLPSAPKHRPDADSAASQLQALYPAMAGIGYGPHDAGLLSRLDTGTSGLLLAAKTKAAFETFRANSRQALHKVYAGLVAKDASVPQGHIDLPLGPHQSNRRKVAWGPQVGGRALPARTRILETRPLADCTLVLLEVNTAYRHQLRAHLAYAGCPLLGDVLYGGAPQAGLSRHALHSQRLRWTGAPRGSAAAIPAFEVSLGLAEDLASVAGLSEV
jgi:23S rRNA pseudouridine1911/1915/1917 synthase